MTRHCAAVADAEGYGLIVAHWLPRLWAFRPDYLDETIVRRAREAAHAAFIAYPELRA